MTLLKYETQVRSRTSSVVNGETVCTVGPWLTLPRRFFTRKGARKYVTRNRPKGYETRVVSR